MIWFLILSQEVARHYLLPEILKRKTVGLELDIKYCELAKKRILQEVVGKIEF